MDFFANRQEPAGRCKSPACRPSGGMTLRNAIRKISRTSGTQEPGKWIALKTPQHIVSWKVVERKTGTGNRIPVTGIEPRGLLRRLRRIFCIAKGEGDVLPLNYCPNWLGLRTFTFVIYLETPKPRKEKPAHKYPNPISLAKKNKQMINSDD
jgi:hypothetical protein